MISRAADVLRALRDDPGGMSLGQIARAVNLPRSTVQRIVSALSAEGLVSTDPGGGGIRLGPELQSFARVSAQDTKDMLRPIMRQISEETGETVDLAVLDGGLMHFVDQCVGSQRLRTVSSIGERFPLTTTANGKAALACLEETEAAALVLAEIDTVGPNRPSLNAILSDIENIRNGALALDEDEHTDGVSAIGFAVRDSHGDVYAVSIPVPSSRYSRQKETLASVLTGYRQQVETRI